jgi:Lactonase, 7-bladed beta-propeller/Collagen triple helix repeat (20 copies)
MNLRFMRRGSRVPDPVLSASSLRRPRRDLVRALPLRPGFTGCASDGDDGRDGDDDAAGQNGDDGAAGQNGAPGANGQNGRNGQNGQNGSDGAQGPAGPQQPLPAVYTLANANGSNEVASYLRATKVSGNNLVPIASSTRPLSGTGDVRPTNISFSPDGKFLVVAERFANRLDTFAVTNGVAQPGSFQTSAGAQPFAFDFSPEGHLIVAEVGDGSATGSSVSSYSLSSTGVLTPITSALATLQGAACWLVVSGGYAYVANAASATITGVVISETGALSLRDASGATIATGAGAIDLAVTPDRGTLYSLAGNPRAIHIFTISADGGLTAQAPLPGVPTTAVGLAVR